MGRTRTDAASVRTDVRARLCLYSRPLLVCVTSHHFIINGHANVVTFSEAGTQFGCADKVPLGVEPNEVGFSASCSFFIDNMISILPVYLISHFRN